MTKETKKEAVIFAKNEKEEATENVLNLLSKKKTIKVIKPTVE